jgi:16S rRNA (guanine527-N7)-methyltransferase
VRITGERDGESIVRKHVVDSLAVVPHLPAAGDVIDVGSGGGFPGIIAACMRPDLPLVLIEARRRRASFLKEAVRSAGLHAARVLEMRAEDAPDSGGLRARGSLVIARGLRIEAFIEVGAALVGPKGRLLSMQTPKTRANADESAARHGLRLSSVHAYTLLDGERRLFFFFERRARVP